MVYDIGNYGLQIVLGFAFGFGAIAQLLAGRDANRWLWIAGVVGWIAGALFASEVLVGKMTVEEIQPIIDGLAFDEALIGGLLGGLVAFGAAWLLTRHPAPTELTHRPSDRPLAGQV
jgi:hypothetical protein